jgi:hypothetical protein
VDDLHETHGVCEQHLAQFLAPTRGRSSAGLQLLIVVRSGDRSLYEYLTRVMAGVPGVHVMEDRRLGQRRGITRPVSREHRKADRRQPRSVVQSVGCTFVRFSAAYGASRAS